MCTRAEELTTSRDSAAELRMFCSTLFPDAPHWRVLKEQSSTMGSTTE